MLFPTIDFAVFFLVVFTGSWVLRPRPRQWRWFILLSSCVFYLDIFRNKDEVSIFSVTVPVVTALIAVSALVSVAIQRAVTRDPDADATEPMSPVALAAPFLVFIGIVAVTRQLYALYPTPADENWRNLYLLLGVAFVNQTFATSVFASLGPGRARTPASRWLVRLAVVVDLSFLFFFKYWELFRSTFNLPFQPLNLVLPLAISFFLFQAISYVIDVGRGELRPISQLDFTVYLTFFAHLVAGPIVRVSEFHPQLSARADPRFVQSSEAFMLVFRGLVKKVVVASYLAQMVDPVFALPANYSGGQVLLATYAYAIQIYADFSGYTDIAIGVALLLGIRFPQNFDAPYSAASLQDFWRRWHMTLSRWLRDYLYIPLGGNRRGEVRTYVNLFLTMVIGGFWHGANWTFVVWGAIHGGGLAVERRIKEAWARRERPLGVPRPVVVAIQWLVTFHVVVLAWVFFRARDFANAFDVLGRIFVSSGAPFTITDVSVAVVGIAVVLLLLSQFVPPDVPRRIAVLFGQFPPLLQIVGVAAALVVIDAFGPEGVAPFIYFRF